MAPSLGDALQLQPLLLRNVSDIPARTRVAAQSSKALCASLLQIRSTVLAAIPGRLSYADVVVLEAAAWIL